MTKRVEVPQQIAARVLFESDRTCCVCRERGQPVQVHHMDEDPSNNASENLAVLCLLCHRDTQVKGGFDRKLDSAQVRLYRDDWVGLVHAQRVSGDGERSMELPAVPPPDADSWRRGSFTLNYINALPGQRRAAYTDAQAGWDSGTTAQMVNASYGIIHCLQQYLVALAAFYPRAHFHPSGPGEYFDEIVRTRFAWHRAHYEPNGAGSGGTMIGPLACGGVTADLERMVAEMVRSLTLDESEFDFSTWMKDWRIG